MPERAITEGRPWFARLLWFALLYGAGVLSVGLVALAIRKVLKG